jgi:hypothetical protein
LAAAAKLLILPEKGKEKNNKESTLPVKKDIVI